MLEWSSFVTRDRDILPATASGGGNMDSWVQPGRRIMLGALVGLCWLGVVRLPAFAQDNETGRPPTGPGALSGVISDFEDGQPSSRFGSGWTVSTDQFIQGKSSAQIKVVDGGADGSQKSLEVTGEIVPVSERAWAGAMFFPGAEPFAVADLSERKSISFWAKGDGKTYRIMFFTQGGGRMPGAQTFTAGPEWKKISFPFSAFDGTDGHDVRGIMFVGGPAAGKFDFQIDQVELQ